MILQALQSREKLPQYAYAAPELNQGINVVWGYFKDFLKDLPGVEIRETAKEIVFKHNKAKISIIGLKNIEAIRGRYFNGILIDEYSNAPADAFGTVIYPALLDKKGWAIIMGTPNGNDHFCDLFEKASLDESGQWMAKRLSVYDSSVFGENEIEEMKQTMTQAQFLQEMCCEFNADTSNKYYLELINRAEDQGRIGDFAYNPRLPVYVSFDLGRDGTALWFAQQDSNHFTFIDYWEKVNCKLPEVIQVIMNKGYIYSDYFLPHDSIRETIESESSTFNQIKSLLSKTPIKLERIPITEGIALAQTSLIKCRFDKIKCKQGIECLKNYQAKIDKKRQMMLDTPLHDKFSHGSDSFRYMIQGLGKKKSHNYNSKMFVIKSDYDPLSV